MANVDQFEGKCGSHPKDWFVGSPHAGPIESKGNLRSARLPSGISNSFGQLDCNSRCHSLHFYAAAGHDNLVFLRI